MDKASKLRAPVSPSRTKAIDFVGSVPASMRQQVENLFFFNPAQPQFIPRIRETVAKTGAPLIIENGQRISIGVPSGLMQCLFACTSNDTPVGVALYCRPAPDLIWISHLAVLPDVAAQGGDGDQALAGALVGKIMKIARSIRGVSRIQLPYRRAGFLRISG